MYLPTYLHSYLPTKRSQQHKMYPTNPETDNHKTKAEMNIKPISIRVKKAHVTTGDW